MKAFLIIPIILLSTIAVSQTMQVQTTPNAAIKSFFPKLKGFKLVNQETTGIIAGGCVAGNCKDGSGTWMQVSCPNIWIYLNSERNADLFVRRFQGKFSADGNEFEGIYSEQLIQYSVARKGKDLAFEPVSTVLLSDENAWTPHLLLKGNMSRSIDPNYGYDPAGWRPLTEFKDAAAGMPRTVELYFESYPSYARITYAPGGVLASFTGKISRTGDPLCGRFQYSDGSKYEGFVYRGRYLSFGQFTDAKGNVKEGIWRLDSLEHSMPVSFPPAAFEPQLKSAELGINYFPKEYPAKFPSRTPRTFTAEKGWAFAYDSMNVVFGQVSADQFTGKAMWINFYASKTDAQAVMSYHVGEFIDCELQQGFRINDDLDTCEPKTNIKDPFPSCRLLGFSVADAPHFDYDQINGCGRKVYYSADGKPRELVEGYFAYAPVKGDDITGWGYINDWAGLRQPANLQFRYQGQNAVLRGNSANYYHTIYQLEKNQYCFPSMEIQGVATRKRLYEIYDSMNVNAEAMMKERETVAREAREKISSCMAMLSKYNMKIGHTLANNNFVGVLQDVDCQKETMTLVVPGGASTANGARVTRIVPLSEAFVWHISDKQFHICSECEGLGGELRTTETSKTKELPFGYFSGIETKVTHTKTETRWQGCLRCGGRGVILE